MFRTMFKSPEEIRFSLRDYQRIGILSCSVCANLSDTGGEEGLELLRGLCEQWGKQAEGFLVCGACVGTLMEYSMNRYVRPIADQLDALLLICCAGGVKAANIHSPGLPVVAACDSLGSIPLTPRGGAGDSLVVDGICPLCEDGHCVLSYTAGICPVTGCPLGCRYGFCDNPPEGDSRKCTEDLERDCVWLKIEREAAKRGVDIAVLEELKMIHENPTTRRMPSLIKQTALFPLKKTAQVVTGELFNPFADFLHWVR